ncbi:MAG: biopolymer transporter ExbD [Candidatus Ancaeobacter aquaticus]|nr:biopolymer transporter ExbD [Candidatus Ancaeobacter aquaticus]
MKFKKILRYDKGWIDFVPFLNVVLLLNIFFVITSTLIYQPGIKVTVPTAQHIDLNKEQDVTVVSITKDDRIYIREKWVKKADFKNKMTIVSQNAPNTLVVIKADSNVLHDRIVSIMDIAIEAGIKRLSIAASPRNMQKK